MLRSLETPRVQAVVLLEHRECATRSYVYYINSKAWSRRQRSMVLLEITHDGHGGDRTSNAYTRSVPSRAIHTPNP